jgi:citrate lyase subunit beta/citryl-CoA lyase
MIDLEPRFLVQMAHLTTPATIWKYVEGACTRSKANLVMLDLEDSIPRGNQPLLDDGRANVVRAFNELDWGTRLRFFRPRGANLDPGHSDIEYVVRRAGAHMDGLIYPKAEGAEEIREVDATLARLERDLGLHDCSIKIEVLIESAGASEQVFEIARASARLVGLIFGSFDYWASLGLRASAYRADHPLLTNVRSRIVEAASLAGVPAIAEMTTNYPTREKSEAERAAALEEFRRDAVLARDFGFSGKWTGIPDQTALAVEIFSVSDDEIAEAVNAARNFSAAERAGVGATMMAGRMADRATDRIHRNTLKIARALGRLSPDLVRELALE